MPSHRCPGGPRPIAGGLVIATVLALGLQGCASYRHGALARNGPGAEFQATEISAFRINQNAVLDELVPLAGKTADNVGETGGWDAVIDAGMDYADSRCESYMHALFRLNRDKKTVTTEIGLLGTASAGLMAAAEAAARDVAAVAIGFGLASSTVDNLSNNLLYDLDPSSVRSLVRSLQAKFRAARQQGYASRPAAFGVIRSYASLCLPASIEAEVNLAVKSAAPFSGPGDPLKGQAPSVSVDESLVISSFDARIDENTAILRRFVFPNGQLDRTNGQRLQDFLHARNIDNVDVSSFMRLGKFASERAEAVRHLNLQ